MQPAGRCLPAPVRNPRRTPTNDARARSIAAARAAATKNAADTVVLDVGDIIGITDAFVITSGNNVRQVKTIAEEVERQLKELGGGKPVQVEGLSDATWVLLDYGDFVVHVFQTDTRAYYDLERLWSDAPRIGWEEAAAAVS
ncbi:MAG TPA: ribosome silencing factor [Acidimicrobiales bacterium]